MVLFPLAFIWVAVVLIWVIRKGSVDPDVPEPESRRWRPRAPSRPWGSASSQRRTRRRAVTGASRRRS